MNTGSFIENESGALATVTVVVPAYRSQHLTKVLDSVRDLQVERVVVVDSSPEDPAGIDPSVTVKRLSGRTMPAAARNAGTENIHSDFILFIDSDVVLTEGAKAFVSAFLRNPHLDVVCGTYRTDRDMNGVVDELQNAILRFRLLTSRNDRTKHGSTSHMLVRREVFDQVGGFNPELPSYEDIEFSARCYRLGFAVTPEPQFEAVHLKRYSVPSLLRDYFIKAYQAMRVRLGSPAVFRGMDTNLTLVVVGTLICGCLVPVGALNLLVRHNVGLVDALVLLGLVLSPVLLWRTVFRGVSGIVKLLSLVLWPLIGWSIATAVVLAFFSHGSKRVADLLREVSDWIRCGARVLFRYGRPIQIIHYVTARCNLRCEHCFYKETLDAPNPGEMSLETMDRTTRDIGPVLWYSLAGGEPFLRSDLVDIVGLVQKHCRPKVFSFPTNGWFVERTYLSTLRMLERMNRGNLILFFSLDGPEPIHDAIRGEGSFSKAVETIERLRPLQDIYPNLYLSVVTTVTTQNALVISEFVDYLVREISPSAVSINLFRYHSLDHPPVSQDVLDAYDSATQVYAEHLRRGMLDHYGFFGRRVLAIKELLQKELILRVAREDTFVTPCTAGTLSYVIDENGTVAACEILPPNKAIGAIRGTQRSGKPLRSGPINSTESPVTVDRRNDSFTANGTDCREATFSEMVQSSDAKNLRTWIRETECHCTYECAMSTNTLFSWPFAGRLYGQLAKSLFTR
ncbi:MAG: hypothetical protein CL877_07315 [Dehalococcoidales bacterium]|jgi:MoaA/NifB/PqqE/SkfB family radical SAM enzyme|nr:hypothetical protein [Dehalococcoidales bacterium]|tara:strand:+ start:511 stop:2724 length:2214 start_codon:yes stop_codon:yes gene_type:complete